MTDAGAASLAAARGLVVRRQAPHWCVVAASPCGPMLGRGTTWEQALERALAVLDAREGACAVPVQRTLF